MENIKRDEQTIKMKEYLEKNADKIIKEVNKICIVGSENESNNLEDKKNKSK